MEDRSALDTVIRIAGNARLREKRDSLKTTIYLVKQVQKYFSNEMFRH